MRPPFCILRTLFLSLALLGVLAAPAAAQFSLLDPPQNPDDPSFTVDIGFGGSVWPNRWTPVTITVTGGGKPFEGIVTVEFQHDEHTAFHVARPLVATPGKSSTTSVLVHVPLNCATINVVLRRPNFRVVRRTSFVQAPLVSRGEAQLPNISASTPIVLGIGEASASPALAAIRAFPDIEGRESAIGVTTPAVAILPSASLPPTWAAFDSVLLLVVSTDAARGSDPRFRAAVREWVSAGGRLVLLADTPDDSWQDWLTPEACPVFVSPLVTCPTPVDLADALARPPPPVESLRQTALNNLVALPGTPAAQAPQPPPKPPEPAEPAKTFRSHGSIAGRPITLGSAAGAAGWQTRYTADSLPQGAGLLAEGPFGFGWITVIGFDPQRVASAVDSDATRRIWYDVLQNSLRDWRDRAPLTPPSSASYVTDSFMTGGFTATDVQSRAARNTILEEISAVPAVGGAVFPLLALGLLVLALLLGPFDALVLRRLRLRHRSWLTALTWIGLAALAAYLVPTWVRSGATRVNCLSMIDVLQTEPTPESPTLSWRTGITGVFAGQSDNVEFAGALGGTWWRPAVSRQEHYWGRPEGLNARSTFSSFQAFPNLGALQMNDDPWSGFRLLDDASGGNIPAPTYMSLWTFRTFQEEGRTTTPLRTVIERVDDAWQVDLHGLPATANIENAALHLQTESGVKVWFPLMFSGPRESARAVTAGLGATAPPAEWRSIGSGEEDRAFFHGLVQVHAANKRYAVPFNLTGPERRTQVINSAVARGDAVLFLAVSGMPPIADLKLQAEHHHTQLIRLVAPTIGAPTPAPEPAAIDNPQPPADGEEAP